MEPNQGDLLKETYRLSKENNRMLHSMRRSAFIGGILKFIFYIFVFVIAPLWIYATYLSPMLEQLTGTMNQIRGTSAGAQAQFEGFGDAWDKFRSQFSSE